MARDAGSLIGDMLTAIDDITTFTKDMQKSDFISSPKTDRKSYLAVVAAFIQLAEAAKALPDEFKAAHPQIDWRLISGMRNLLVHEYFRADAEVIWLTARGDKLTMLRDTLAAAREG